MKSAKSVGHAASSKRHAANIQSTAISNPRVCATRVTRSACQLTRATFADIVHPMADSEFIHPGITVRQNCLERFNLTVTEGALVLGVSRQALTNLLSGKAGISPEMALRLDKAFGGGAETWLQRQVLHDLAKARLRLDELNVVPMVSAQQPALF